MKLNHKRILKALPAVLGAAALVTGLCIFLYRLPTLQASADTIYDNGGHLSSVTGTDKPSSDFIGSYNNFGLALLKRLGDGNKNVFVSPASVYLALGMTYNGAQGQTASEFAAALDVTSKSLGSFNNNCLNFQNLITGSSRFRLANSIWLSNGYKNQISDSFLSRDKSYFGATVGALDFSSSNAPAVLNRWVKSNTNGRIDPKFENFDPNTTMALINTIYFKSDWAQKFDGNQTRSGSFAAPTGSKTVKFMNGKFTGYFDNDYLQGIVLPYDDQKTSMLILLPKKNLNDMLGKLAAKDLAAFATKNLNNRVSAVLSLPRVNFKYSASLNNTLKAFSMQSAFDSEKANFGGMTKSNNKLYISEVKHMTYLAIDEKGTEAAGGTYIAMMGSSGPSPKINSIDVNHPFLTAIVDNSTGAVLFAGEVNDPSAS